MIDKQTIERIKSALSITEVIGKYVTLRRAGRNLIGVCPFHNDSHPSMTVSPSRNTYKCFVCGHGGDVIRFIQDYENLSFAETMEWCARETGIPVQNRELTDEERTRAMETESMRVATKAATTFFQKHLPEAQSYLRDRGYQLTDPAIKNFQIGYAPDKNIVGKEMIAAGFSEDILKKAGILSTGQHGNTYDVFRDRIMFPFIDLNGNITGFSGRLIVKKENTGKYINTGDTPLFRKGAQLFGLYQARKAIARMKNAYLVEGQFDVISFHAMGVENTIAGSGTALTPEQIKLISRFTDSVTLVYDPDAAGIKAALKNCELLLQSGLNISCVSLPPEMDPDKLALQEKENTRIWLENNTIDFVTYFEKNMRRIYYTNNEK